MPTPFDMSAGPQPQQIGPGSVYFPQPPPDFTSPWIGGYPENPFLKGKRRFPWDQPYEQPQGGMNGMQSGPGYSPQSAPWLDGNHMQGIQRRGMPGQGQGQMGMGMYGGR
jgi:hypothetical protein